MILNEAAAAAPRPVDFNHQIRPLLSDKCFACHGPDEKSRKAKLRLDQREGLFKALEDGMFVVAPGRLEKSEMHRRITSSDPDEIMPPPESKLALAPDELDVIKRWIAEGAPYKGHWAFLSIEPVPIPETVQDPWVRNPIDAFVLEGLREAGMNPAPEAERETWLRRVSLDLTGLPPSLAEMDVFLADDTAEAYAAQVDRLLELPAYGERMANDWLDAARYADTYGYQADMDRDMFAWRDWVIRAFNENLGMDDFILWQVAGDLLPGATRDQILATAFNRLHRQTNEGGSIEEEFRTEYVADRVQTMGTALLGLTLECAKCHDHKYDPITQADFYRFAAFFNNIDESGLYSHFTRAVPAPTLLLYEGDQEQRHRELKDHIAAAEKELETLAKQAEASFADWMNHRPLDPVAPEPLDAFPFEEVVDNKTPNLARPDRPARLSDDPISSEGRFGRALEFNGDNALICTGAGDFKRSDPFSISLWLYPTEPQARAVVLHRSRAWTDSGSRGYELVLEEGRPSFNLIHFWPGNAIGVRALEAVPLRAWSHWVITYDGSSRAGGIALFRDGTPVQTETVRDHLDKDIVHRGEWGDADVGNIHLTLAGRFRDSGFKNGKLDELRVFDKVVTRPEIARLSGREDIELPREAWREHYLRREDAGYRQGLATLRELRRRENDWVNDVPEIMVMREMVGRRPTFKLRRGAYDAPGEAVEPGTPESLLSFDEQWPRNRLGLARWMVDRRHPLTARVLVNRVWKIHFGRGLVATLEDFGSQGQRPSHPALLDWLAGWFIERGWDRKALHKLIVTSATYRQTSRAPAALVAADPDNRLLGRGPKQRLTAEQIRDGALAVSGLLSRRMGGPSVKPYQPAGLWEESGTGKHYEPSKGEGLYRRSLYTFWRRTAPPPSMLLFDATSREVCTARREVTSTPLQALVLLNDPQFVEASRALGERLLQRHGDQVAACLEEAFRLVLGRCPTGREAEVLSSLFDEQLHYFESHPEAALQYLRTGDRSADVSLPAPRLAAAAVVVNTLFNHDEFVLKR